MLLLFFFRAYVCYMYSIKRECDKHTRVTLMLVKLFPAYF